MSSVRVTDFLTTEEFFLDKQLKTVFILRDILNMGNTQLFYFLSKFQGQLHPEFWIQVCKSCGEAVSSFYATQKEISSLQTKLLRISGKLKGQIYKTKYEKMGTGDGSLIWKDIRTSVLTTGFLEPSPSPNEATLEEANNHDNCEDLNNYSAQEENDDAEDFSGEEDDADLQSDWEDEEEGYENSQCQSTGDLNPTPSTSSATAISQLPSEKPSSTTSSQSPKKSRRAPPKYNHYCEQCPAKFTELRKMKKHLNLHSILSSRRVTTCFCGWVMRANTMRLHMKLYHEGGKQPQQNRKEFLQPPIGTPYYCDHCQMIFTKLYNLRLHFKAFHLGKVDYVHCTQPKCEGKFENQQLLHFHLDKVHGVKVDKLEESEEDEKCPHCETIFSSKLTRDFHIAKRHQDILLTCTVCNFTAKGYQHYQMHMETSKAHATTQKFSCELCGKQYWALTGLEQHRRKEHFKELRLQSNLITCQECGKVLKGKESLNLHIKFVHHGENNFSCEFCGKAFKKEKALQIHLNSFHTGRYKAIDYPSGKHFRIENPEGDDDDTSASKYYCEFCPLVFPNHKAVHKHLLAEHYEALTYCCEGCEKRFCAAAGLHRHRLSCPVLNGTEDGEEVDGEREPPQKKLKLPCNFCPKGFSNQRLLLRHKKYMHKDQFDNKCEGCGKVFMTELNLMEHRRMCKKAVANIICKIEIS
ncbi:unnamed protein product [Orchesella dallaii]